MQPKPLRESKTIWVNAAVTTAGVLATLAAIFGQLAPILAAFNLDALSAPIAAWFTAFIALVGAINMVLRLLTGQPIEGTKAAK